MIPRANEATDHAGHLSERVLQFGTGMLLRAVCAASVDRANRAGDFRGRIVVVQSTPNGVAEQLNRQRGEFTLAELGIEQHRVTERAVRIGSISRAFVAGHQWSAIREVISRPELRVIVSNVTEAGFRLDAKEPALDPESAAAPGSFPAKLTDLLFTRFTRLPDGPSLFIIPTELVDDNGPALARMVDEVAGRIPDRAAFRDWIFRKVRFCSSLVDRITTGTPSPDVVLRIEKQSGTRDPLLSATEPYLLWAIEGDPATLREAFPIDHASRGAVIFADDIGFYRQRKLRVLNGAHTALAPLALTLRVPTVAEAVAHAELGPLLTSLLHDEVVPAMPGDPEAMHAYAASVLERFANPSLQHEWRVIATNQTAKMRVRLIPTIVDSTRRLGGPPLQLTAMFAAALRLACELAESGGEGWWSSDGYRIVDVDRQQIHDHWRRAATRVPGVAGSEAVLGRFVRAVLGDVELWGQDLCMLPGFADALAHTLYSNPPREPR